MNLRGLSVRPTGKDTARGHTPDWEGHSKRTQTGKDTARGHTPDWEGHSKRTQPTGKDTARGHTPDWEGHSKRTHTRLGRTQQEDTHRLERTHPREGHTPTGKDTPRLGRTQEDTPRLGRTQQEDTPRLGRTQQEDTLGRTRPGRTHTDWEGLGNTPRGITAASGIQTENLVNLTQRSCEVGRGMDKAAKHSATNRTHCSRSTGCLPLAVTAWSSAD